MPTLYTQISEITGQIHPPCKHQHFRAQPFGPWSVRFPSVQHSTDSWLPHTFAIEVAIKLKINQSHSPSEILSLSNSLRLCDVYDKYFLEWGHMLSVGIVRKMIQCSLSRQENAGVVMLSI